LVMIDMADTGLAKRLQDIVSDDHERGCDGRYYSCKCGYDGRKDALCLEAADKLTPLFDATEFLWAENVRLRSEMDSILKMIGVWCH